MQSEPHSARTVVWALPLSLAATYGIIVIFSSSGYLDVSVHRVPPVHLWIQCTVHESSSCGFPHSDICGSMDICSSPQLFAAYHVFLRLSVPRHPPCALLRFTTNTRFLSYRVSSVRLFADFKSYGFNFVQFYLNWLFLGCLNFVTDENSILQIEDLRAVLSGSCLRFLISVFSFQCTNSIRSRPDVRTRTRRLRLLRHGYSANILQPEQKFMPVSKLPS